MSLPTKFKPKSGFWHTDNKKVMWFETDCYGNKLKEYDPLSIEGISRYVEFKLVFLREIQDENSYNGKKKLWFTQDVTVQINDNVSSNIVLRWESASKKWFLSDLSMLGQTMVCPLESDSCVTVIKSEPYKITQLQAQNILKASGWGFGKVDVSSNGNLEYYVTC